MFSNSKYPKNDLMKFAKLMRNYKNKYLCCDDQDYQLEKNIFVGFYFIRKLIESSGKKITSNSLTREVSIFSYPYRHNCLKILGSSRSDYSFDDSMKTKETMKILKLSHLFIHSQLFFYLKKGPCLTNVYITSDKYIDKKIFEIKIDTIIDVFEYYANNYVTSISLTKNENGSVSVFSE